MSSAILADSVTVSIDGEVLLHPVSFEVPAGGALAVAGPNGAGKTTLLRVLAGLTQPSGGSVSVLGAPIAERRAGFRASVAALIGAPAFARDLTVREQLRFLGATWGRTPEDSDERADGLLEQLGISHLRRRFSHELSSGQVQLVSLALTLARPFDVLLLDEPEQRLDANRRALVGSLLRAEVARGATLVFASHDSGMIDLVADRTLTVGDGPA